ncbi:MAG TPA: lysylphosphatidylglycerol synthase transmembrane domain-containing protein [Candidatus Binatia bacterium]|nr:lysylphosphatidylglycerol synthase transmembrane domain-containing protein [Candidatus Binatia bacterium]
MTRAKPVIIFLIKLLVSAGLIAYFVSRIHLEQFVETFASAKIPYIALALGVYLVAQGIAAVRWAALARPLGIKTPFKDLVQYYLIGMFFNLFAPSTVGGDVTRVYYLVKDEEAQAKGRPVTTVHAAMSVLMDRAIGMVILVWLGAFGLLLFPQYAVPPAARTATFLVALALLGGALLAPLARRFLPEDGHQLSVKLRLALRSYRLHWGALLVAALLSLTVHLIQAWMHTVMGRALDLELPFSFCLIVYPLVGTFSAIPISVNGFGLREGGYIFLLAVVGIGAEQGVAFGILLFLIVALDSVLGGLLFLFQRKFKQGQASEAAQIR